MNNLEMAKLMWDAYAGQGGGQTYDGRPLHTWKELGAERQSCWIAAASVTASRIEKLEAALREIIQEDALTGKTVFVGDLGKIARKALEEKDGA